MLNFPTATSLPDPRGCSRHTADFGPSIVDGRDFRLERQPVGRRMDAGDEATGLFVVCDQGKDRRSPGTLADALGSQIPQPVDKGLQLGAGKRPALARSKTVTGRHTVFEQGLAECAAVSGFRGRDHLFVEQFSQVRRHAVWNGWECIEGVPFLLP